MAMSQGLYGIQTNAQRKKTAGDMMKNLDAKEIGTEAILGSPKPCLSKRHSDLSQILIYGDGA